MYIESFWVVGQKPVDHTFMVWYYPQCDALFPSNASFVILILFDFTFSNKQSSRQSAWCSFKKRKEKFNCSSNFCKGKEAQHTHVHARISIIAGFWEMTTFTTTERRRFWAVEKAKFFRVKMMKILAPISLSNFPVQGELIEKNLKEKKCWHLKKELLPNSRKSQLHFKTSRWMVGPFSWCRRLTITIRPATAQQFLPTISVLIFHRLKIQGGSLDSN